MKPPREIAEIEATLGCTFTTRELGPYVAFQSPLTQDGGQTAALRECDRVTNQVRQHCLRWKSLGYTVFVGYLDFGGHTLFAIPQADPLQLMDIFDVGRYNDFSGDTAAFARRYMARLFETDPFVPYMVDAANFRIRFLTPVSSARAGELAEGIAEFNPDAYQLLPDLGEVDDPIQHLRQIILKDQKLELWWD
jgi:hypothetical protein